VEFPQRGDKDKNLRFIRLIYTLIL
jgi:hypothetical protein